MASVLTCKDISTLAGARFLVTGGALRIGRAICRCLGAAGARLVVHCRRSREAADELVGELGGSHAGHRVIQGDLTDTTFAGELIASLHGESPLHGLVNNASVYRRRPLAECDPAALHADFVINFTVPFQLMRQFRRVCGCGAIVNLLDQRVSQVDPGAGTYGLAKKALRDATEAAALEWAPDIRVNAVAPGFVLPPPGVHGDMSHLLARVPMRRRTTPEEIAQACVFLAASPIITGQILFLDGGQHLTSQAAPEVPRADYASEGPACG